MAGKAMDILLIEDNPGDVRLLQEMLAGAQDFPYTIEHVSCLADGLTRLSKRPVDIVLLDLSLPDSRGMGTFLASHAHAPEVPIIILSGLDDEGLARQAVRQGAQDYLVKGQVSDTLLVRSIQYAVERKQVETQLVRGALHDALTGLPNRSLFLDRLHQALDGSLQCGRAACAVLFLDLDRFKQVNDSLGHVAGDQLLIAVAQRLTSCVRRADTVARLGGDEFAVLLRELRHPQEITYIVDRLLRHLEAPITLKGHDVVISVSVGIAMRTTEAIEAEDLLRNADSAMYQAKMQGRGRYAVFDEVMHDRTVRRLQIETGLRHAIARQELRLHYQPMVELSTGQLTGFEALLRWQHPERGLMLPDEFIPVAEETALIVPIGEWVLEEACKQVQRWQRQHLLTTPLLISVNVSGKQFAFRDLANDIERILDQSGLEAHRLCLEMTEMVLMDEAESAEATLRRLQERGVQLWIDDFGSGYSSLNYLYRFPISVLKIDRALISHLADEATNEEIIRTIVSLGRNLDVKVVAEGIETIEQLRQLQSFQCPYGQGYHFSPPVTAEAAQKLLHQAFAHTVAPS